MNAAKINIALLTLLLISSWAYADYSPTDKDISDAIESEIVLNGDIPETDVNILTHDGVVTLVGTVDTVAQYKELIDIAKSQPGVKCVDFSRLRVERE